MLQVVQLSVGSTAQLGTAHQQLSNSLSEVSEACSNSHKVFRCVRQRQPAAGCDLKLIGPALKMLMLPSEGMKESEHWSTTFSMGMPTLHITSSHAPPMQSHVHVKTTKHWHSIATGANLELGMNCLAKCKATGWVTSTGHDAFVLQAAICMPGCHGQLHQVILQAGRHIRLLSSSALRSGCRGTSTAAACRGATATTIVTVIAAAAPTAHAGGGRRGPRKICRRAPATA